MIFVKELNFKTCLSLNFDMSTMTDFQVKANSHAELSFRSLQSLSILLGRGDHCVGDSNKVRTSHITCTHVQGLMVSIVLVCAVNGNIRCIVLGMRGQWQHKMYCVGYARSMAT